MCAIASDESLIRAAQQGCPDAWQRLFERYQPRMHGFVRAMGAENADDICQEAWVNLVRYLDRFESRDGAPFWTWLAVIVKRIVWRSIQRERYIQIVYDVPLVEREDLEQTALGRVFAMQLLSRLPDARDRAVLELRVWHDLTFAEIGQRLGIEKNAARDYYERALLDLRTILNGIAPPETHIHHAPGLSAAQQAECVRRYSGGELSVKALADLYGVSPITMQGYVSNTKLIECARCGATAVRPARANSPTCASCLADLDAAHERWCAKGTHAVPIAEWRKGGACAACMRDIYQQRKATGYYDRAALHR